MGGGGGLGLLRSHECTEFITPGAQMVSGCLSQVQVHVWHAHTHTHTQMHIDKHTERDKAQARQTLLTETQLLFPFIYMM